uniref:Uncharacterized protein n=1 Tax=Anguilla anguilla TaxID=7936 RepID=A0A0E9Q8Y0_ANGAN
MQQSWFIVGEPLFERWLMIMQMVLYCTYSVKSPW